MADVTADNVVRDAGDRASISCKLHLRHAAGLNVIAYNALIGALKGSRGPPQTSSRTMSSPAPPMRRSASNGLTVLSRPP